MRCPKCHSEHVDRGHWGSRAGTALGLGLGLWGVFSAGACAGAEGGALVGTLGGPVGTALGGCGGALVGGMAAIATASLTGNRLGSLIDAHILNDHVCLDCGYRFQASTD